MVKSSLTQRTYHPHVWRARQAPVMQFSLSAQRWLHAPQFTRSTMRSLQEPEQSVSPVSQAATQPRRPHFCPAAHWLPQAPQL
jgi:hypothetical protein